MVAFQSRFGTKKDLYLALLDAGIDVISTVNVQHLESLNDVVERITGPEIELRQVVTLEQLKENIDAATLSRVVNGEVH